eukprot:786898-Prorocentrum_minimum.AAC.1
MVMPQTPAIPDPTSTSSDSTPPVVHQRRSRRGTRGKGKQEAKYQPYDDQQPANVFSRESGSSEEEEVAPGRPEDERFWCTEEGRRTTVFSRLSAGIRPEQRGGTGGGRGSGRGGQGIDRTVLLNANCRPEMRRRVKTAL